MVNSKQELAGKGLRKMRCSVLNEHGFRCRWPSVGLYSYHGGLDSRLTWVVISLCAYHASGRGHTKYSEKEMRAKRKQQLEALARGSKVSEVSQ